MDISKLPKKFQLLVKHINDLGYDDIRDISITNYEDVYGNPKPEVRFKIVIEAEKWVKDGYYKDYDLEENIESFTEMLGIDYYDDCYIDIVFKNNHRVAKELLPRLKTYLKSQWVSSYIHSLKMLGGGVNPYYGEPTINVSFKQSKDYSFRGEISKQKILNFIKEHLRYMGYNENLKVK